jgi:heme O synthase-like polyprenyltransferase
MFQYFATAVLGSGLLYYAARQILLRSRTAARELLKATIIYLPLQFLVLVLGKG